MDRAAFIDWYRRTRRRSRALFDMLAPDVYYSRPIPLRHPIVFYEGHLPAFSVNTLLKKGLGHEGIDAELERLFARGIDPADERAAAGKARATWPDRARVRAYGDAADAAVIDALTNADLAHATRPALVGGEAIFTAIEHELMHQETLLYIWHQVPHSSKHPVADDLLPAGPVSWSSPNGRRPRQTVRIPAGRATLGIDRREAAFGWDNEFNRLVVEVGAFDIDACKVSNGEFLEFVETDGYRRPEFWSTDSWAWRKQHQLDHPFFWVRRGREWTWRGMLEMQPLPLDAPVYVTHAEAVAYAQWQTKRLPTEAEFHRAAFGRPDGGENPFPWGEDPPDSTRGNFDFRCWDPVPCGSFPAGQSAFGVEDLVGNAWEWTATVFAPFPGFEPMASYPEYSADFFDGEHYVIKGASCATARELVRRSFRNWFRPNYPFVYAGFRCAS
ncbi:MAG: ergothioneine biosynthesis protein EgtB [Acidobacteria bacterium]|nr:ergothioneine biosynthesis protein EgtB [Acidobacteriota bacterium]